MASIIKRFLALVRLAIIDMCARRDSMNQLYIYFDESGTMPISDGDEAFIGAALGFFKEKPTLDSYNGHREWLAETLSSRASIVTAAFVKPYPGFSVELERRLRGINSQGKRTQRTTGANARYFPPDGINARNLIWISAMEVAVVGVALRAVSRNRVEKIVVILDQKTLVEEEDNLVKRQTMRIGKVLTTSLVESADRFPEEAARALENTQLSEGSISVLWRDDPGVQHQHKSGLRMAHYAVYHTRRALLSESCSFADFLKDYGVDSYEKDITHDVVSLHV